MKAIIIISLISCSCIFAYWYLELANDYQKQYVKDKASTAGQVVKDKSKEIYDNRSEYIDKAKEIGSKAGEMFEAAWKDMKKGSNASGSTSETNSQYFESHFYAGKPVNVSYPNDIMILENEGFVVAYDNTRKNPAWVCYRLFEDSIETVPERPSRFSVDKRTTARLSHDDYKDSGFNRAQLAPNHAIALRYGVDAQKETFLMTNVVPQKPDLNQGPWRKLEEKIGTVWANDHKMVWVITGPIYYDGNRGSFIGLNVPDAFFKIVLDELPGGDVRMMSYIIPQDVERSADYLDYLVSVDKIEGKSGFDFFTRLEDDIENSVEAQIGQGW